MSKTWNTYIIVGAIAVGIFFEILKSANNIHFQRSKEKSFAGTDIDFQPYSRLDHSPDTRAREHKIKSRQMMDDYYKKNSNKSRMNHGISAAQSEIEKKATHAADATATGNDSQSLTQDEKNKALLNQMTKKATAEMEKKKNASQEAKKLKDKKEKEEKEKQTKEEKEKAEAIKNAETERAQRQAETERALQEQQAEEEKRRSGSSNDFIHPSGTAAPVNPSNVSEDKPENFTAEEWSRRVLNQPSLEETNTLIKYQQSNLISPDVYYSIVQQMLEDSRERMRELGVVAIEATPSYRSFVLLAHFFQEESVSSVRQKAARAIERYNQYPYLAVIEAVYRSKESISVREKALQLVISSAKLNLIPTSPSSPEEEPNLQTQSTKNPVIKKYMAILAGLEQMLKVPGESSLIINAAQNAIEAIKPLLPTTAARPT